MRAKIKILKMSATYMRAMEAILKESICNLEFEEDTTDPVQYKATYHALLNTLETNKGKVRPDRKPNYPYQFVIDMVDVGVVKVRLEMMMDDIYRAAILDYVINQSVQLIDK
jgi:hypothetical protein